MASTISMDEIGFDVERFFNEIETVELEPYTAQQPPSERPGLMLDNAHYNTTLGSFFENSPVSQNFESPTPVGYDDLTNAYPIQQYGVKQEEHSPVSQNAGSPQSFSSSTCSSLNSPYQVNLAMEDGLMDINSETLDNEIYTQSPGIINGVSDMNVQSCDTKEEKMQPPAASPISTSVQQGQPLGGIPQSLLQQKDVQQLLKLLRDQISGQQGESGASQGNVALQIPAQTEKRVTEEIKQKEQTQKTNTISKVALNTKEVKIAKKTSKSSDDTNKTPLNKEDSVARVPQVFMVPPVVLTTENGGSSVQSALTAVLANSSSSTPQLVATSIPIKIVTSTSATLDQTPDMKVPIKPLMKGGFKPEKTEKRSNHNIVEKKYRMSISDNLKELKELVFGPETKCTKAGILRKAIDHIKHLRKINNRLKQENMQLRMAQKQTTLLDLVKSKNIKNESMEIPDDCYESYTNDEEDESYQGQGISEPLTPEETDDSCASPGSDQSVESVQPSTFSMMDKTRFMLSVFMFAFMFCGPLKYLIGPQKSGSLSYMHPHAGGRTLLSVDETEIQTKTYSSWIVHFILYVLFFMWLLIKGEPKFPSHSKQQKLYLTYFDKANQEIKKGDFTNGFASLERCLYILGRPLSTSKIDLILSFQWNTICHVLNQFGILPLLKYLAWVILPRRQATRKAIFRYCSSCELAARVYAKMHEIVLLDPMKRKNSLLAVTLYMSAINSAENAEGRVEVDLHCRIYVNAAIYMYTKFGIFSSLFMRHFLRKAITTVHKSASEVPPSMTWIFHPAGYQFLLSGKWTLCMKTDDMEENIQGGPFDLVSYQFRMLQVKKSLTQAVAPGSSKWTIKVGEILKKMERSLSSFRLCFHQDDGPASWWYGVISSTVYIHFGLKDKFVEAWKKVEEIRQRNHPKSTLGQILYSTLRCMYELESDGELTLEEVEEQIMDNEDTLQEYFVFEEDKTICKDGREISKLMAVISADLMLQGRLLLWEKGDSQILNEGQLLRFEQDLDILEKHSAQYPQLKSKIEHYYQLLRLLSGSSPLDVVTEQVVHGGSRDPREIMNGVFYPEQLDTFEESKTLLFTCKHASSTAISNYDLSSCISKLRKVGVTLENAGLKDMTEECKQLLTTFTTASF